MRRDEGQDLNRPAAECIQGGIAGLLVLLLHRWNEGNSPSGHGRSGELGSIQRVVGSDVLSGYFTVVWGKGMEELWELIRVDFGTCWTGGLAFACHILHSPLNPTLDVVRLEKKLELVSPS